jgi:hypothetical protein
LGLTFSFLVALFHRKPLREGFSARSAFLRSLERSFGWLGILTMAIGVGLAATAMALGSAGWEMSRLWLWLLGSALFFLVGIQLLISWIVARVLETLAEREDLINREMSDETSEKSSGLFQGPAQDAPVI